MKNTKELAKELRKELTRDILFRYNNSEYWDNDIIDNFCQGLTDKKRKEILDKMFI